MAEPQETEAASAPRQGRNLSAALIVGIALIVVVVAGLVFWPPAVVILVALLAALATTELNHALQRVGMHASIVPVAVGVPVLILASYAAALWPDTAWAAVRWAVVGVLVLVCLFWRMPQGAQGYSRDVAGSLFIVGYVGVLASFIGPFIAMDSGPWKVATMFLCVVGSDTGGYFVGATLGKHPLAPKISPKKTWEGMVGSVILSGAVGILMTVFVLKRPWWLGFALAILIVIFATLGDLVESLIKRDVGIKDMSSVLPGHGGIMERLDSMLVGITVGWLVFLLPL